MWILFFGHGTERSAMQPTSKRHHEVKTESTLTLNRREIMKSEITQARSDQHKAQFYWQGNLTVVYINLWHCLHYLHGTEKLD